MWCIIAPHTACLESMLPVNRKMPLRHRKKWSRNTGGSRTMDWEYFFSVSQWDRRKHMAAEWKLVRLLSGFFFLLPYSSDPYWGPYWHMPGWRWKRLGFTQNFFSICFGYSFILYPLSPPRFLISHAIDWNPKRQDQSERNPPFLWIVDWMWWQCGVLFL